MYKTVRKGDASLQYTILPQTDQFVANGSSQSSNKPRPKVIKYTMGTLMLLVILSCIATPFLMNQSDHNLFASTMLAMGRVEHSTYKNTTKTYLKTVTEEKMPSLSQLQAEEERRSDLETTSMEPEKTENNAPKTSDTTIRGLLPTTTTRSMPSTSTSTPSTSTQRTSTLSSTTMKPLTTPVHENMPSNNPGKVPSVLLKLRENETIPQMYMKAGIVSYKKGNITTSVLAHELSLEGLIIKTPEGTIRPWPQKWPFVDASSYFQWKGISQMPVMIYIVLAGLAALASISIVVMFYVQKKASRRQRQSVEEPEAEGQEEDKSTLLGSEVHESEDKE